MDERLREILAQEEAWVVGGAIRDELLLRPVLDLDDAAHPIGSGYDGAQRHTGRILFGHEGDGHEDRRTGLILRQGRNRV